MSHLLYMGEGSTEITYQLSIFPIFKSDYLSSWHFLPLTLSYWLWILILTILHPQTWFKFTYYIREREVRKWWWFQIFIPSFYTLFHPLSLPVHHLSPVLLGAWGAATFGYSLLQHDELSPSILSWMIGWREENIETSLGEFY